MSSENILKQVRFGREDTKMDENSESDGTSVQDVSGGSEEISRTGRLLGSSFRRKRGETRKDEQDGLRIIAPKGSYGRKEMKGCDGGSISFICVSVLSNDQLSSRLVQSNELSTVNSNLLMERSWEVGARRSTEEWEALGM